MLAVAQEDIAVTTIENLSEPDRLHPLQQSFITHDAFQCGYCTPGQICSAAGMLAEVAAGWPSAITYTDTIQLGAAEIRERMSGNLCRCGAYTNIVTAILAVADRPGSAPR